MSRYRVIVLRRAERDIDEAVDYIAERAPLAAKRWLAGFNKELQSLATHPERWGLAPENGLLGLQIRQLIYRAKSGSASRALFVIAGDQVRVLRIRRPGEDVLSEDELF
jgi:plasmid stabilization system protein ParE